MSKLGRWLFGVGLAMVLAGALAIDLTLILLFTSIEADTLLLGLLAGAIGVAVGGGLMAVGRRLKQK